MYTNYITCNIYILILKLNKSTYKANSPHNKNTHAQNLFICFSIFWFWFYLQSSWRFRLRLQEHPMRKKFPRCICDFSSYQFHVTKIKKWKMNIHTFNTPHFIFMNYNYPIPNFDVETEIAMEELVMFIMEFCIRLPGLPPLSLKINSGMVDNAMIICINGDNVEWHWKNKIKIFYVWVLYSNIKQVLD